MAPCPDPCALRVLMVGPSPDGRGGISSLTATLLDSSLPRRVRLRHVVSHRDGSVPQRLATGWTGLRETARSCAAGEVDVVHVMLSSHGSFWRKSAVMAAVRRTGTPIIAHIHGGLFDRWRDRSALHGGAVRRLLDRVDVVVVLTDGWRDLVRGYTSNPHIEVLPNPVDTARFSGPRPSTDGPPEVLLVGRLDQRKGTDTLLEAIPLVLASGPPVRFVLAGDGPLRTIRRRVWDLGLQDHVRAPGWLDRVQLDVAFAAATLVVLPSRNEGLPLSVLEGMAAGLPVVASDIEGNRAAVVEGRGGWLVPPGDAAALARRIRDVLDDPTGRREMGLFNLARARERFDVEVVVIQLERLYRDLAQTRSR